MATSAGHKLTMPPKLTILSTDRRASSDDALQGTTSRRTSQIRPKSWVNYQHERQRSQQLKMARAEEEEREREGREVKTEMPMIEWTSALFRRLFRRRE